jgi:hypothetical protein
VGKDHALERTQLLARLQAVALDELEPRLVVDPQRVALPPGPVEGEHLLLAQVLAGGMGGGERVELRQQELVPSQLELRVEARFECQQAELVQSGDLDLGDALEDKICERGPAPQVERRRYPGGCRSINSRPRRPRSREMQFWMEATTVLGGRSPQSSSISRSVETTWFGYSSSTASTPRCFCPPSGTGSPSASTSSAPRSRKSIPAANVPAWPCREKLG